MAAAAASAHNNDGNNSTAQIKSARVASSSNLLCVLQLPNV